MRFGDATATKVTCARARSLVRRWIKAARVGGSKPIRRKTQVGGWRCRVVFLVRPGLRHSDPRVNCTASEGRRVRFYGI